VRSRLAVPRVPPADRATASSRRDRVPHPRRRQGGQVRRRGQLPRVPRRAPRNATAALVLQGRGLFPRPTSSPPARPSQACSRGIEMR
jgi:hypothetical protein